jgi:hypothetical protein
MKRWPVIRHIRYWWLERKVERWCWQCYQVGLGLGHMNPSDRAHLDDIWAGRA